MESDFFSKKRKTKRYKNYDDEEEKENQNISPYFKEKKKKGKKDKQKNSSKKIRVSLDEDLPDSMEEDSSQSKSDSITEYEQERLKNIQQNRAILESLGLASSTRDLFNESKKKPKSTKRKRKAPEVTLPSKKYSLRSKGSIANEKTENEVTPSEDSKPALPPEEFEDSSVFKYTCLSQEEEAASESNGKEEDKEVQPTQGSSLKGFKFWSDGYFSDESLSKIYSMSVSSKGELLCTGGHGGHVSIFGMRHLKSDSKGAIAPLLSFKAHKGWISGVQFMGQLSNDQNLLLTASNDKSVVLWNVNKEGGQTGKAQQVAQNNSVHSSGIFSFHELNGKLLTGSKDSTVGFSTVTATEIKLVKKFSGYHDSVIKCVKFRDENVFASTGNDMIINVMDVRKSERAVDVTISNVHDYVINSVAWHPFKEHILASSAFDNKIQIHDIRNTNKPLFTLIGHINPSVKRVTSIYHPIFCGASGECIVTSGEKSNCITLYSSETGAKISKGTIGEEPSALLYYSSPKPRLAVAYSKYISLLYPQWTSTNTQ